ncbi:MAG: hypothetical protein KAS12_02255, partial [Candidatus Aenigmarchaeota archaeon]|nr:hypothetical protein [Candidatus Aenigmarchaeota archaeon]
MKKLTEFDKSKMFAHNLTQVADVPVRKRIMKLAEKCLKEKWLNTDKPILLGSLCAFCKENSDEECEYNWDFDKCDVCVIDKRLCNYNHPHYSLFRAIVNIACEKKLHTITELTDTDEYKMMVKYLNDLKK